MILKTEYAGGSISFASRIQSSELLETTGSLIIMVNNAKDAPLGNGVYTLVHSPYYWHKHPQFIFQTGNKMTIGVLDCSDLDSIKITERAIIS